MQTPDSRPFKPKPLQQLLDGKHLRAIVKKAQQLERINQFLWELLEPELSNHCLVINFNNGYLTIAVDAAAWLVRLKFLAPQLIPALRQHALLTELRQFQFHIQPPNVEKPKPYWKKTALPAEHAKMITEIAEHISDDKLRKALLKLANGN